MTEHSHAQFHTALWPRLARDAGDRACRRHVAACALLLVALPLVALAGGCASDASGPKSCVSHTDCEGAALCIDKTCQTAAGCQTNADCPDGGLCLPNGQCQSNAECLTDEQCCEGQGPDCDRICESFVCAGSDCSLGDSRTCFNGCHSGVQTCSAGLWTTCSAPELLESETCGDGIDNDCNGKKDDGCASCGKGATESCETPCGVGERECDSKGDWGPCVGPAGCDCLPNETRACNTPCGDGTQSCSGGMWTECDAWQGCTCTPRDVTEVLCGECQVQKAQCDSGGEWVVAACLPQGECSPGDEKSEPCGNCELGLQAWTCSEFCSWTPVGDCQYSTTTCSPADSEEKPCEDCGARQRVCQNDCSWGPWSACAQGCTPEQTKNESCGPCGKGTRTLTCSDQCVYEPGECVVPATACEAGTVDAENCPFGCGQKTRTCTTSCSWGAFSTCAGVCEPSQQQTQSCGPGTSQGICQQGEQSRQCLSNCQWSGWPSTCPGAVYPKTEICGNGVDEDCNGASNDSNPDVYEPNSTCASCYQLNSVETKDIDTTVLLARMDNDADRLDFFCFYAEDNLDPTEHVLVELTNQPAGMDNDLYLFHGLTKQEAIANCDAEINLQFSATEGDGDEIIDSGDNFGTDDGGFYIIEVRHWFESQSQCGATYTLTVNGFN